MDLDLLRSLVAVAESGAITGASARLGLTQPALSRRIQLLEDEFGAQLLHRSRTGAQLTDIGTLVEHEARLLIERYDTLKSEVASRQSATGGTVRIGGGATAVSFVLPDAIAEFQRDHANVHFHVKEASSREIAGDVADGRLELGLVTRPVRATGLEITPLLDDHIVLVGAADNPLSRLEEIDVGMLDGQDFVGFEGGSAIRQLVDTHLREAGVAINVIMELRSIPAILRMVATTGSLAFVSQMGVPAAGPVRQIPLRGPAITRRLGLARRKGYRLSRTTERFANRLLSEAQ